MCILYIHICRNSPLLHVGIWDNASEWEALHSSFFFFFFWRYAIFACKSGLLPYQFHSIKLYRCDRERMNFCMGDTYICIELNERPVEPGHILYRFVFMASNMTIHCLQQQHITFEVYLQNYFWFFWKQPVWVLFSSRSFHNRKRQWQKAH